ncbi:MAG TPA: hypothetical protein VHX88_00915 [Solirubrobacteraceae bacterium]|jgi:hypothetical protein|nr:hypothetical protein [Solirubrobacteraceae bacterium]
MTKRTPLPTSAAAVAAVSLLAAGCGGGSSKTTATTTQTGLLAYSQCMHVHGVPGFPDPTSGGEIPKAEVVPLVGSPQFSVAERACRQVMPGGSLGPSQTPEQARTRLADGLSFARCMRSRGVTRFPDPTAQGELTVQMVQAQGIDLHDPAVLQAAQACLPASHGELTAAKVREALAEAGG